MTPQEMFTQLKRGTAAPVYLLLGQESYQRGICRQALIEAVLPPDAREDGLIRHDLDEISLNEVLDDANSFSLFAPTRLIWVTGAEVALPRGKSSSDEDGGDDRALKAYVKSPAPGVTLVIQASRYDFEGEDKTKLERVRKFYASIPVQVEFHRFTTQAAQALATKLAAAAGIKMGSAEIEYLVEALGGDAARIAVEIEKLRLFRGVGGTVTEDDITTMVPDARDTTIFALVAAVGRKDRRTSLSLLDTLVKEGEYLPLALSFLGTQFRQAYVAQEAGLRNAAQIQAHFSKQGIPMWRSRAEQVAQTATAFPINRLASAIRKIAKVDIELRDANPDDRVVMEEFILNLTA
jgi:DNA polymerase III subunit delta